MPSRYPRRSPLRHQARNPRLSRQKKNHCEPDAAPVRHSFHLARSFSDAVSNSSSYLAPNAYARFQPEPTPLPTPTVPTSAPTINIDPIPQAASHAATDSWFLAGTKSTADAGADAGADD